MKQNSRIFIFSLLALASTSLIVWVFWQNELKFLLPTPKPKFFNEVAIGEKLPIYKFVSKNGKPKMLHFFNPSCPCSRFNMKEFKSLVQEHSDSVDFYLVLQHTTGDYDFNKKYDLDLPVINDINGELALICGVYSTPQSVLIKADATIYYKGNYNKSRYCESKKSRYADVAITYLLGKKKLPVFDKNALVPYGCTLPSAENDSLLKTTSTPFKFY